MKYFLIAILIFPLLCITIFFPKYFGVWGISVSSFIGYFYGAYLIPCILEKYRKENEYE